MTALMAHSCHMLLPFPAYFGAILMCIYNVFDVFPVSTYVFNLFLMHFSVLCFFHTLYSQFSLTAQTVNAMHWCELDCLQWIGKAMHVDSEPY